MAALELLNNGINIAGVHVWEVFFDKHELGISGAPEHETGNPLLAAGTNYHIDIGYFWMIEMLANGFWGNLALYLAGDCGGVGDFLLSTVIESETGSDAGAIGGHFFGLFECAD